ncbi:hypothetical protein [Microvirga arsenatis]|uniref:hypothetical protein n=1 Tax=Microvirga arsenatis TaxID=2692265 RepID=UPI00137740BF|nr:hypothetical protein [Microvirga arsenatis]NBJ13595.1 hypothetical protein [Microvirga arsenatis]
MKKFAFGIVIILFATGALAQENSSTPAIICRQARGLVAIRGAVVLRTGPYIYDRYVSGQQFCQINERARPVWVPTADVRQCFVGYRCQSDRQQGR